MSDVVSLLKPYVAYVLIDPHSKGNPYFTFGLIRKGGHACHGLARRLIYNFSFQHDQAEGDYIGINHESGDFFLYGVNLATVFERLEHIHDLVVFDPRYHQPVTAARAPVFTRMEVKLTERRPHTDEWLARLAKEQSSYN